MNEGGSLLHVLEMLEDADVLRLSHTFSNVHGILQQYLARYYKGKNPTTKLACEIGGDEFETELEGAADFTREQIRKVGRNLGRRAPSKKNKPTHVYLRGLEILGNEKCAH